jgi:hypothetical protein
MQTGARTADDDYPEGNRLADYSSRRLPAIWRTQEFSNWMLTLLHVGMSRSDALALIDARASQASSPTASDALDSKN